MAVIMVPNSIGREVQWHRMHSNQTAQKSAIPHKSKILTDAFQQNNNTHACFAILSWASRPLFRDDMGKRAPVHDDRQQRNFSCWQHLFFATGHYLAADNDHSFPKPQTTDRIWCGKLYLPLAWSVRKLTSTIVAHLSTADLSFIGCHRERTARTVAVGEAVRSGKSA